MAVMTDHSNRRGNNGRKLNKPSIAENNGAGKSNKPIDES